MSISSLHDAIRKADLERVNTCLKQGIDSNQCDAKGRSPLYIATVQGSVDVMKMLVINGANVSLSDCHGNTPLHVCGHVEALQFLYENGADVDLQNKAGNTPLDTGKRRGVRQEVIDFLQRWSEQSSNTDASEFHSKYSGLVTIWYDFCLALGPVRLALLFVGLMMISLYVAITATGYAKDMDTRIPVDSKHIEL